MDELRPKSTLTRPYSDHRKIKEWSSEDVNCYKEDDSTYVFIPENDSPNGISMALDYAFRRGRSLVINHDTWNFSVDYEFEENTRFPKVKLYLEKLNFKQKYVLGFAFNSEGTDVLLITKNKPDWQKDKLNGLGGKIEKGETIEEAMIRECNEESGLTIEEWTHLATYSTDDFHLEVLYSFCDNLTEHTNETPEGELNIYRVDNIPNNKIYNLNWLIPLCFDDEVLKPIKIKG